MATWEVDAGRVLGMIDTSGADEWARGLAVAAASTVILGHVIAGWPVDTGLSVAGFRRVRRGSTWIVYNDVEYTSFVWEGLIFRLEAEGLDLAKQAAREALVTAQTQRGAGVRGSFELRRNSLATRPSAPSLGAVSAGRTAREATAVLEQAARVVSLSGSAAQREALTRAVGLVRRSAYTDAIRALRAVGLTREADELRRVVYRAQAA